MTGTIDTDAHQLLLLARLQDLASDLMTVSDMNGTILYLNPATRNAYGIAPGDGVGDNLNDYLSAETMAMLSDAIGECLRTGATTTNLTINGGADGHLRLETNVSIDRDAGLFYNVQRDVSGEIQEARSLEFAERFLALTGDAIAMFDGSRAVVRTNDAFDRLFGVSESEHRTLDQLVAHCGAFQLLAAFESLDASNPNATVDVEVTSDDSRRVVSAMLQFDAHDELRYLVARDVTEERLLRNQLVQRAGFDALTELANRSTFLDTLERRCLDRHRTAIVLVDLDGFKEINDAHGHATGDALLSIVAERMTSNVRETDMVARLGGDEFVVMTTSDDPMASATAIARQLRRSLAAPYEVDGTPLRLSASIGVAATVSGTATTPSDLLHEADAAMYTAKRTGRNKFVVFDDRLRSTTQRREQLGDEIETALACGQIDVDVQGVFNLSRNEPTGAEALVRWDHPTRGRLGPVDFLDIVVDKGLMMELTRQVLERTVSGLSGWLRANPDFAVSINVSPMQLRDPNLLRFLVDACAEHGIKPQQLICEFTEERLVDTIERTGELLQTLRTAGFRIAIDDFGAGASSLAYFRLLPIDFVKIDKGLIENTPHSIVESTVVEAIARLAMDLGFAVCAEGVESADQVEWLTSIGCTFVQGYHKHRPEPIEAFLAR